MSLVQMHQAREGKSQALEAKAGGDQLWLSPHQDKQLPSGQRSGSLRAAVRQEERECRERGM